MTKCDKWQPYPLTIPMAKMIIRNSTDEVQTQTQKNNAEDENVQFVSKLK